MEFEMDTSDFIHLQNEVDRLNRYGVPNAVRDALTSAAFETRDEIRNRDLPGKFQLRNTFTQRSVMANRATGSRIDSMKSEVGSTQEYMAKQEDGFTKTTRGKHGLPIPTPASSGEVNSVSKRLRGVLRRNYLNKIKPVSMNSFNNPRPKNWKSLSGKGSVALAARAAIEDGSRVIFIDRRRDHYHRKTGLYRVMGGHLKNPHQRGLWPAGARLVLLYSMTKKSTVTKGSEWMGKRAKQTSQNIDKFYESSLLKWIERGRMTRR